MKLQPISKTHAELGQRLSQYKIEHDLHIIEMGKIFGIHHVKLSRIMNGTQEITLSEYIRINDILELEQK